MSFVGYSYVWGGMSPSTGFDCSGLMYYVLTQYGYSMKRVANDQMTQGTAVSQYTQGTPIAQIKDLKKGDLVFFGGRGNTRSVGHVGIVTDVDPSGKNFSFVHASNKGVKISDSREAYYSRRYIGARRIVEN